MNGERIDITQKYYCIYFMYKHNCVFIHKISDNLCLNVPCCISVLLLSILFTWSLRFFYTFESAKAVLVQIFELI